MYKESPALRGTQDAAYPQGLYNNQANVPTTTASIAETICMHLSAQAKAIEGAAQRLCQRLSIVSSPESEACVPSEPVPGMSAYFSSLNDIADHLRRTNDRLVDLLDRLEI